MARTVVFHLVKHVLFLILSRGKNVADAIAILKFLQTKRSVLRKLLTLL